ncbi:hypothetical protein SISSUDRAFT_1026079 [Sistotremastrum suecicum HHB10207 ss-3]|uniref:MARVEL domain-containing protein n=1 Tax=Sistotremastrum suecicum HHB10207 ss-3 TaxID=1314776 RepID=A0A166A1A2_9AGAM|nr:hypothetical protein SISSUDRAFT_1026079 [Sistotremastrum suecicum HHB10207 ss-3]
MANRVSLTTLRIHLYILLFLFSVVLMGISAGRLHYTTHIPRGDPLNGGKNFFDPIVPELLVTAILLVVASATFLWIVWQKVEMEFMTRLWFEIAVLSVLWVMLTVGQSLATSIWPNLTWCIKFTACQVIQAMIAFAWFSWAWLTLLIFISLRFAIINQAWWEHIHGWNTFDDGNWRESISGVSGARSGYASGGNVLGRAEDGDGMSERGDQSRSWMGIGRRSGPRASTVPRVSVAAE